MKLHRQGSWWRIMVLLTIVSMVLAACGGSNGGAGASPSSAASTAAGSTAASPAGASPSGSTRTDGPGQPPASPSPLPSDVPPVVESPVVEPSQVGAAGGGPQLNPNVSGNIDFWHFWSSPQRRTAIKRVIALCQKELPNIKVNDTPKPFSDIYTANTAAVAAGSGMPDVIVEDRPKLPNAAANNIEQSLQQYAQRDGIDGSQFWPFTWQQTLYKDEPYGIPFETDVRVLYWNKNAFEEAGLDPNKPPKTWAELEEYANKLDKKNPDGSYARIGFSPLIGNIGPEIWGYTNDVQWVTEDGKPSINDPKAVETVEWIKKWIDRYGGWQNHQNFKAGFAAPPNDAFMSGKVAMYVDINGYASTLNFFRPRTKNAEGKDVDLQWGVSDLPYKTDKASWSGGFALSIPRGADGADAAWEFIKCATGPEAQASWARDTYAMPANQAAAKDPTLLADPNWQMFVDAMSYTTGGNYLPQYPNWGQELGNRYEKVWTGELSPQDALQQAQQAVEAKVKGQ